MKWFRLYDEIPEDYKMIQLTDTEFRIWIYLLCYLNKQPSRGYCSNISPVISILKRLINCRLNTLQAALDKFESLQMIKQNHPTLQIVNWDKRQYKSDDNYQYVKDFRKISSKDSERSQSTEYREQSTELSTKNEDISTKQKQKHISPMLGEFTNVKLSWGSLKKLESQLGKEQVKELIEALSSHMASTGKVYVDHHATIYSWAVRKGLVKRGNKTNGGEHDNLFLRTIREEDERATAKRMGKRPEKVS